MSSMWLNCVLITLTRALGKPSPSLYESEMCPSMPNCAAYAAPSDQSFVRDYPPTAILNLTCLQTHISALRSANDVGIG